MAKKKISKGGKKPVVRNTMWGGRFASGPAAIMEKINTSIGFDWHLYRQDIASFDTGGYNHHDAEGFINLLGLPAAVRSGLMKQQYEALARTV